MAINKMVKLSWEEESYEIKMTMEVIDKLDDAVCIVNLIQQIKSGEPRLAKVAKMFNCLLNEAGAKATVEEVYDALFGANDWTQKDITLMTAAVFNAIIPEPKKKSTTPSTKKRPAKKKT